MKIAIFHNAMDNIGGAEVVGLTLAKELKAPLFSTNIDFIKVKKMGFESVPVKSIGKIPLNAPLRQQMALKRFSKLRLNGTFQFYIIDGDWALSSALNNRPNLWYVHSPMREIWDLYQYTRENTVPRYARWIFDVWVLYNRYLSRKYIKHVDHIVCNSKNTQNRLRKYLNREAKVVYPPIDTKKFYYQKCGNYWLSVNRLITHKRVEMQMEAFKKLKGEHLVIVGSYEQARHFKRYVNYLKNTKPENVCIKSWVDEKELRELYANCKGFITTAKNEDFGMSAVEAMASGKAVIAPNEGGYTESVIDGKTGKLIDDIDSDKLIDAIKDIGRNPEQFKNACLDRALEFDKKEFIKKIKQVINET